MQFQPKIIIGSLFGILTTIISIIAIFFPSLLNLEKENIDSFQIDLAPLNYIFDTKDTYLKLYEFLYNHQNKVVKLSILYNEFEKKYILDIDDILNRDKHLKIGNQHNINGVYGYADLEDMNAVVLSSFYQGDIINNIEFYRAEGSIGIYYHNDKNNSLAYILSIPYNSDMNHIFKWSAVDINKKYRMEISGIFYIEKFTKEKFYFGGPIKFVMPSSYFENECNNDPNECKTIEIITLQPISPKDFASHKY